MVGFLPESDAFDLDGWGRLANYLGTITKVF